ncbi:MAG: MFS transporter [Erysipelotrichaceae bacterium]|jgi:MFS family permease|nr:MFS transporter [Erysipelotrichaceae bacterium]
MKENLFSGMYRNVLIAMCGLSCCAYGIIANSGGVFFTPIAETFGVGKGAVSLTLTISGIATAVGGLLVPKILKESSWRKIILIASVLILISTLAMAYADALWILYLANGIRGFGAGLISYVTISIFINQWFYAKHGFVTSLTMSFSGISGALLSPIFTGLIQSLGWRSTYLISMIFIVLFLLPAIILPFSFHPESLQIKAYGAEIKKGTAVSAEENNDPHLLPFLLLCLVSIASNSYVGIVQHLPSYAIAIGNTAEAGALMLSLALIGNIVSKLLAGTLADIIGTKNALWILSVICLFAILLLFCTQNILFLYLGALLMGCGYGIGAVGITLMTKSLFGLTGFVRIYPIVSFLASISFSAATALIGWLFDLTGSYLISFEIGAVLCALIFLAIALAYQGQKKQKA